MNIKNSFIGGNMEKIYTVTIGEFCNIEKTDFGYRYELNPESIHHIDCIKNDSDVIDIDNGNNYYLLKRDLDDRLDPFEYRNIKLNTVYAIRANPFELRAKTRCDSLITNLKAIKTRINLNKSQKQLKKQK